jgi:hypothetical protein
VIFKKKPKEEKRENELIQRRLDKIKGGAGKKIPDDTRTVIKGLADGDC